MNGALRRTNNAGKGIIVLTGKLMVGITAGRRFQVELVTTAASNFVYKR
jgi:hypothetical protein